MDDGRAVTKASVQLREGLPPLFRVKLPVLWSSPAAPFFAGCTLGRNPQEVALHVGTRLPVGPSLRLTYRPMGSLHVLPEGEIPAQSGDDFTSRAAVGKEASCPLPQVQAVLKTGLGRWGSAAGSALSLRLELDLTSPKRSRLLFKVEPRVGDISLRRFAQGHPNSDPPGLPPLALGAPVRSVVPGGRGQQGQRSMCASHGEAPASLTSPPRGPSSAVPEPTPDQAEQWGSQSTAHPPHMKPQDPTLGSGSGSGSGASSGWVSSQGGPQPKQGVECPSPAWQLSSPSPSASAWTLERAPQQGSGPVAPAGEGTSLVPALSPEGACTSSGLAGSGMTAQAQGQAAAPGSGAPSAVPGGPLRLASAGLQPVRAWVQRQRREQGWDLAVRSRCPLGTAGVVQARWRLCIPGDRVEGLLAGPAGEGGGGPPAGVALTLQGSPMLALDKLSLLLKDSPPVLDLGRDGIPLPPAGPDLLPSCVPQLSQEAQEGGTSCPNGPASLADLPGPAQVGGFDAWRNSEHRGAPAAQNSVRQGPSDDRARAKTSQGGRGWLFGGRGKGNGGKDISKSSPLTGDQIHGPPTAHGAEIAVAAAKVGDPVPDGGLLGLKVEPRELSSFPLDLSHPGAPCEPLGAAAAAVSSEDAKGGSFWGPSAATGKGLSGPKAGSAGKPRNVSEELKQAILEARNLQAHIPPL